MKKILCVSILIIIILTILLVKVFYPKEKTILKSINASEEQNMDLKNLESFGDNYTIDQAIEDGYYSVSNNKKYNIDKINNFINNVNKNKESEIIIFNLTYEGDIIITKITYKNNMYEIIIDLTRDSFSVDNKYHIYNYKDLKILDDELIFTNNYEIETNDNSNVIYHNDEKLIINI